MELKYANQLSSTEICEILNQCGYSLCLSMKKGQLFEIEEKKDGIECVCSVLIDKTGTYVNFAEDESLINQTVVIKIEDFNVSVIPDGIIHDAENFMLTKAFLGYMSKRFGVKYDKAYCEYTENLEKEFFGNEI